MHEADDGLLDGAGEDRHKGFRFSGLIGVLLHALSKSATCYASYQQSHTKSHRVVCICDLFDEEKRLL